MSNLVVIPGKMEDINKILNKDIKGIILGVKSSSIYPLELDIDSIIDIKNNTGGECDGIRWSRIVLRTGFRRICSGTGRKNTELCHNMCTYQRRGSGITLGLLVVFCQNG